MSLIELENRLAALEDENGIRTAISRYCYFADGKRDDDLVALLTDDAVFGSKTAGQERASTGKDEIRAQIEDPNGHHRPDLYGHGMHLLGENLIVELNGDQATASSYSILVLRRDDEMIIHSASSNQWSLRKEAGTWKIAARHRRPIADDDFVELLLLDHG